VAVALAGCGGDDSASNETQTSAAPTLSAALAEELALVSDDVAELVEAGDSCAASERVADLRERTLAAVENGDVPPALEQPLVAAVEALESQIVCEPATTEEGDEDEGDGDQGKGKAKGKDKKDEKDNPTGTTGTTGTTETVATTTTTEQG
jgi:hypothetical protein